MNKIQEALLETIDNLITKKLKNLGYCYYLDAVVIKVNSGRTYDVRGANGSVYTKLPARPSDTFIVNDIVQVCVKNGDFSRKFIDGKRLC